LNKKYKSFYPLPGGWNNYVNTLTQILNKIQKTNLSMNELKEWCMEQFETDEGWTSSYIRGVVLRVFAEKKNEIISLTENSNKFLDTQDNRVVLNALLEKIMGFDDILSWLYKDRAMTHDDLCNMFIEKYRDKIKWTKRNPQVKFRIDWLRCLGYINKIEGNKYALTKEGKSVVAELIEKGVILQSHDIQPPIKTIHKIKRQKETKKQMVGIVQSNIRRPDAILEIIKNVDEYGELNEQYIKSILADFNQTTKSKYYIDFCLKNQILIEHNRAYQLTKRSRDILSKINGDIKTNANRKKGVWLILSTFPQYRHYLDLQLSNALVKSMLLNDFDYMLKNIFRPRFISKISIETPSFDEILDDIPQLKPVFNAIIDLVEQIGDNKIDNMELIEIDEIFDDLIIMTNSMEKGNWSSAFKKWDSTLALGRSYDTRAQNIKEYLKYSSDDIIVDSSYLKSPEELFILLALVIAQKEGSAVNLNKLKEKFLPNLELDDHLNKCFNMGIHIKHEGDYLYLCRPIWLSIRDMQEVNRSLESLNIPLIVTPDAKMWIEYFTGVLKSFGVIEEIGLDETIPTTSQIILPKTEKVIEFDSFIEDLRQRVNSSKEDKPTVHLSRKILDLEYLNECFETVQTNDSQSRTESTTDLAYEILKSNGKPMHYKDITKEILKIKLLGGKTPHHTVYARMLKDKRNRFILIGKDVFGLSEWQ